MIRQIFSQGFSWEPVLYGAELHALKRLLVSEASERLHVLNSDWCCSDFSLSSDWQSPSLRHAATCLIVVWKNSFLKRPRLHSLSNVFL